MDLPLTLQEIRLQTARHCPREQRLPRSRGAVEQHALWRLDADSHEQLRVLQRQLDDLPELPDLVVQAADPREADLAGVLERHVVHERVDLAGEHAHDGEGRHVEGHAGALLELVLVDLGPAADDVSGAGGRLDNDYSSVLATRKVGSGR